MADFSVRSATLTDRLEQSADESDAKLGFHHLDGDEPRLLAFGCLRDQARNLALRIAVHCPPGGRVVLALPSGHDYLRAFFAVQYAGGIPVPAYALDTLHGAKSWERLRGIVDASTPALVLGPAHDALRLEKLCGTVVRSPAELMESHRIAFLQFSSGTTGTPRGVTVTHANCAAQLQAMASNDSSDAVGVSWLPFHHDLGLVGGLLAAVHFRRLLYYLSPHAFAMRPLCWLEAISTHRGTTTGGPNFAFALCVRKIRDAECESLDLSSLRILMSGAELVRGETVAAFNAKFARRGFSPKAWMPSYGLAEATLGATQTALGDGLIERTYLTAALEVNRAEPARDWTTERTSVLASCGRPLPGVQLLVVDPETREPQPELCVGEIWLRGATVAEGYWNNPADTATTFDATTAAGDAGWLRSGDLGFQDEGALFLCGRIKEMIVHAGRNIFPQAIEATAARCHALLGSARGAAFAVEGCDGERVVLVLEAPSQSGLDFVALAADIRRRVEVEHDVPLDGIAFIRNGTLPRTSSAKIQRGKTRDSYRAGRLSVLSEWRARVAALPGGAPLPTSIDVVRWLTEWIGFRLNQPATEIELNVPIDRYIADSVSVASLANDLEAMLHRKIPLHLLFERPTVSLLATRLTTAETYADDRAPQSA